MRRRGLPRDACGATHQETFRTVLFSQASVFTYTLRTHGPRSFEYARYFAVPSIGPKLVRLRSAAEIYAWFEEVGARGRTGGADHGRSTAEARPKHGPLGRPAAGARVTGLS